MRGTSLPVDEHVRDHSTAEANLIVMSDARGRSGRKGEPALNAMVANAAVAAERGLSERRVGDLDEAGQETRFWSLFRWLRRASRARNNRDFAAATVMPAALAASASLISSP